MEEIDDEMSMKEEMMENDKEIKSLISSPAKSLKNEGLKENIQKQEENEMNKIEVQENIKYQDFDEELYNSQKKEKQAQNPGELTMKQFLQAQQQQPKPRLIIKQIILENFKSFAGKQTIGPFHKNFTSIVGPNGSGKSNLIESLLFIFGKAAKKMRLNKLSQLIHSSKYHQDLKKASVEVIFQEVIDISEQEMQVLAGSEFSVKRTVKHTSASVYKLNNSTVTQSELQEYLMGKGIDLANNRFLILQGEVEQISLMKPKGKNEDETGLLEYLEELIGSDKYRREIDTEEEKYEGLFGQKRDKGELVKLSEEELAKLDAAKNSAVEFVKQEKFMYQVQNLLCQTNRHTAHKELVRSEELVKELNIKFKEEQKIQKEKVKEHQTLLTAWKTKENKLQEEKQIIKDCQRKLQELEREDIKINNNLKHQIDVDQSTSDNLNELSKQNNKLIQGQNEIMKELPNKQEELSKLSEKKEQEEKKLLNMQMSVKDQTEKFENAKKAKLQAMAPKQDLLNKIESEMKICQDKLGIMKSGNSEAQSDLIKYEEKVKEIEDKNKGVYQIQQQIKDAIGVMNAQNEQSMNQLKAAQVQEEGIKNEILQIQSRLNENRDIRKFESERSQVLKELKQAQSKKELSGIIGRLGDLGAIDAQYDVAISTAFPQLENVVVQTLDAAQKCVEFLKAHRLPKITFIALDKVQYLQQFMNRPFNTPANSKRIFDLIQVRDDALKIAFYYALRDTLVCQDIDVATSIAYGPTRFKCVTFNGVVIDYSGVMSGGGKTKRGAMPTQMAIEHQDNSEDIEGLQSELRKKQEEQKRIQEVIKDCRSKIQEISIDFKEAERTKTRYEGQLRLSEQEAQDIKIKISNYQQLMVRKADPEEIQSISNQQEKLEQERLVALQDIEVFRNELAQIEVSIEQAAGSDVTNQKRLVADLQLRCNEIEKEVSKMNAQLQTYIKNLKTIQGQQQRDEKKLERTREQIKKLKESQVNLENECMNIVGRQKTSKENEEKLVNEIEADNEQKQKIDKLISEIKSAIEKMQKELEEAKTSQKKSTEQFQKANSELEKVRVSYKRIIENYEFMDELEEIATFDILSAQQAVLVENSEEQQQEIKKKEDDKFDPMPKKSFRLAIDKQTITQYDVFTELKENELEEMEPVVKDLTILKTFEQEALAKLTPNINSIMEFKQKFVDYKEKIKGYREIVQMMHQIRSRIDELRMLRYNEFTMGFNLINMKLKETYQLLTSGGDAELELIDSLDPFSEGVVFSVRPPKKSWKQMLKLSGGEKTVSSLSLIFALHFYKPTPLYFMDEIDAALDFKNVSVVGRYIRERTKNAQFIIISLRNHMFEIADRLVGVYKVFDQTKIIATLPRVLSERIGWKGQGLGFWQEQQIHIEQNKENEKAWLNAGKQQVDGIFQEVIRATPSKKSIQKASNLALE